MLAVREAGEMGRAAASDVDAGLSMTAVRSVILIADRQVTFRKREWLGLSGTHGCAEREEKGRTTS